MNGEKNDARMIFMGSGSFAVGILSSLVSHGYNVVGVYTHSPKSISSKDDVKNEIQKLAEEAGILVYTPEQLGEQELTELRNIDSDIIIVAAYGKILPEEFLSVPKFGAINVHPSLLPKYRGPSPIQNVLLAGEKITGTTIMLMDKGIDTGKIISQKEIGINNDETYPQLLTRLSDLSAGLLIETIPDWIGKKIEPVEQNEEEATLCQMIERADGRIIWADDAENIYNRYRALIPWPGIFTFWEKDGHKLRMKIKKASLIKSGPEIKHKIGEVFEIGDKVGVQANAGVIVLEEVQLEGKNSVKTADFLNGNRDLVGSILM